MNKLDIAGLLMTYSERVRKARNEKHLEKIVRGLENDLKSGNKNTEHRYDDCQYCCDDELMRDYLISDGNGGVFIDKNNCLENDLEIGLWNFSVNYCPNCGRKL